MVVTRVDFVNVSETCTEQIGPDGSMHLTAHARMSPLSGDLGSRDIEIQLVVSRDGKILAEG